MFRDLKFFVIFLILVLPTCCFDEYGSSGNNFGKQQEAQIPGGVDFSQATVTEDGRRCVIKMETIETVSKQPVLDCKRKSVEKCHYTYITSFQPTQEQVCNNNFEKSCSITFKQEVVSETIRKCYTPQKKVCNGQGPVRCETVFESSCETRYIKQASGDPIGDTQCKKLPVQVCGRGCVMESEPEECHDKKIDSLVDVPEEICDLNPQKVCNLVTKLVPSLRPKQECTSVPNETCHLSFTTPERKRVPLRTEWCLEPEEETLIDDFARELINESERRKRQKYLEALQFLQFGMK